MQNPKYEFWSNNGFLTGVAEMLAMEMKATGMYVSRGLSFKQAEVCDLDLLITMYTQWSFSLIYSIQANRLTAEKIRFKKNQTFSWSAQQFLLHVPKHMRQN
jgi:hypothetical protein